MSAVPTETIITVNLADLENLIRRVVREELARYARIAPDILDDWRHEGPDDSAADEALVRKALPISEQYRVNKEGWKTLDEFEAELAKSTADS